MKVSVQRVVSSVGYVGLQDILFICADKKTVLKAKRQIILITSRVVEARVLEEAKHIELEVIVVERHSVEVDTGAKRIRGM